MSLDDEVNAIKSPTCQPPSRIKTWKRNICSDGRSNQIECGWIHHLLYINGFGDVAGARVIIAGQCEGHMQVSVLPIMMAHTTWPCQDPTPMGESQVFIREGWRS